MTTQKSGLTTLLLVIALTAAAQQPKILATPGQQEWNYAQAYRSGNLLYQSGVPAAGPMDSAINKVYRNLEGTLKKYGLDFSHVVKENLYSTDLDAVAKFKGERAKFYGQHTPAATWAEVRRLLAPTAILEVEIVAEIVKTP